MSSPGVHRGRGGRPAGVRLKRGAGAGWGTPMQLEEGAPGAVVRMFGSLERCEDGREARIRTLEQCAPFGRASSCGTPPPSCSFCVDPRCPCRTAAATSRSMPESLHELRVEVRFDRTDRDELPVGRLVDVVERRARVEHGSCPARPRSRWRVRAKNGVSISAAPSTMAASITWPWPVRAASNAAHAIPKASSMPPPAKSPSTLIGGVGFSPARPSGSSTPASAM